MKLILFFAIIVFSLIISIIFTKYDLSKDKSKISILIKLIIVNGIILGISSLWWFLTETDGISQGVGVIINLVSFTSILIINIIYLYLKKNK